MDLSSTNAATTVSKSGGDGTGTAVFTENDRGMAASIDTARSLQYYTESQHQ